MKAIITGATGFIGVALCRELLKNGCDITAVIRPNSAKVSKLTGLQTGTGTLKIIELPLEQLRSLPERVECADVLYHLAWNGSSGADREDFDMQYANIAYTASAVQAAKACGCKKIIVSGSQAEYGVINTLANEKNTVPKPFMMYGAAKLSAYHMASVLAKQMDIPLVWARIYSVYGVGENAGTLISYLVESLKAGETPALSPCQNMWNFMYITDCARALCRLGEYSEAEGIYNVASDDTRLLREFVEQVRDIIAPDAKLGFNAKKSDPRRTFWLEPDCGRLKQMGFQCEVPFAEGIRRQSEK